MVRVAINGFGRIGRAILRVALSGSYNSIQIVAINDISSPVNLAHLFKYDTVHKKFPESVTIKNDYLQVGSISILLLQEKKINYLPWKELDIDVVIESTGLFTKEEYLKEHLQAGAKKVVLTTVSKDDLPTIVMGVNHKIYDYKIHHIISNASCTTNCLAPIANILNKHFGVIEGLMTTIHAVTSSQSTVDSISVKDLRLGRAAFSNIIPGKTGAADAVTKIIPELKGKLTGLAFRVPVVNVSIVDFTVKLHKSTTYKIICELMKEQSESDLKGILGYTTEPLVSSDYIGATFSGIFDATIGIGLTSTFYKLIIWYDNETGYSARILDLVKYIVSKN